MQTIDKTLDTLGKTTLGKTTLGKTTLGKNLRVYSIDNLIDLERQRGASADDLLRSRFNVRPMEVQAVLRYTFPLGMDKTDILAGLLEQTCTSPFTIDVGAELSVGANAHLFNRHIRERVVLLPVSAPEGVSAYDESAMLDKTKSICFTTGLMGNLIVMDYVPTTGPYRNQTLAYAAGVVANRAFYNSEDPARRVWVDRHGVDRAQLLLPVCMLGLCVPRNSEAAPVIRNMHVVSPRNESGQVRALTLTCPTEIQCVVYPAMDALKFSGYIDPRGPELMQCIQFRDQNQFERFVEMCSAPLGAFTIAPMTCNDPPRTYTPRAPAYPGLGALLATATQRTAARRC
jgi:hypothetical protein